MAKRIYIYTCVILLTMPHALTSRETNHAMNDTIDQHIQTLNAEDLASTAYLRALTFNNLLGKVLCVDSVYGFNATAARNGQPFATINAALSAAYSGDTVWIFPGTYTESFTIPSGVTVRGISSNSVTISKTSVTQATDLVTMGENSRIEDVALSLTSASAVQLRGIVFPGTTSATARARNVTLTITGTGVIYGVHSTGTGAPSAGINSIENSLINISSSGSQAVRGIEVGGTSTFNVFGCTINASSSSTGSAFGVETLSGTTCNLTCSSTSGVGTVSADISQTAGTLNLSNTKLVSDDANSFDFNILMSAATLTWMVTGAIPNGTRYMYMGTTTVANMTTSTTLTQVRISRPLIIKGLSIRAGTAPGTGGTTTCTLYKNALPTSLTAQLSGTATSAISGNVSVSCVAGDLITMQLVNSTGNNAANVTISAELH